MRAQEFLTEAEQTPAEAWIAKVYAQYPDWPYGKGDKVIVWGSGEDQQFAVFALKTALGKPNVVEIDWFQAVPQRQGVGSRAMAELQRQAQESGISLKLFPWDKGQVSQAALKRFYKRAGFTPIAKGATSMQWNPEQLDEGLRDWIAALAATGAMALGTPADAKQVPVAPTSVSQQAYNQISQALATPAAQTLKKAAIKAGIVGTELAQFMAQCAHESANFTSLEEFGGSLDFRKYDPKYNPRKAKQLGNKAAGDGAKYKGRGYIQLTGRDNYKRAGQALNLPLEQRPELVERPDVAAKVAVWFWQNRVAPKVASYHDTAQVTKPINPAMRGLKDRNTKFNAIKQGAMATPKNMAPRGRKI